MEITETQIDRWLERGGRFFKTVSRNPVVRGALLARGLSDEELAGGWKLYTDLHGFGAQGEARAATRETAAAQAINEIDAWDAPAFSAARAVLDARYPAASSFRIRCTDPVMEERSLEMRLGGHERSDEDGVVRARC